jgi:hypothetical protein
MFVVLTAQSITDHGTQQDANSKDKKLYKFKDIDIGLLTCPKFV